LLPSVARREVKLPPTVRVLESEERESEVTGPLTPPARGDQVEVETSYLARWSRSAGDEEKAVAVNSPPTKRIVSEEEIMAWTGPLSPEEAREVMSEEELKERMLE
jgi:hypothetical protein